MSLKPLTVRDHDVVDPALLDAVDGFAKILREREDFLVVSHHDADGVTGAAIMVDALRFLGRKCDFMILKQLDSTTIAGIKEADAKTIVFTDMGSGQLSLLEEHGIKDFFVVDHHNPERDVPNQINPHFFGYNGGSDVSGSGMSYLVAKAVGRDCLAHLAVVGAVGDMQDSGGRLHSINRMIMFDAIEQGTLKAKNDLRLFGRQSRSLTQMLAYASDPVLPGITGNQQGCAQFLEENEIPLRGDGNQWRNYVDLTHLERRKLTTALYVHLLDSNTPEFVIQRMIGEVYTLLSEKRKTELRDAKEFATLLNACGRQEQPDIGVRVCLGDRGEYLAQARTLLEAHRRQLASGINYLSEIGVSSRENLYFFDAQGEIAESIVGVVAGMAYGARIIPPDKPVLGFALDRDDDSFIKVSARANWGLIRGGIHLGNAMKEASQAFGGEGGGHDIAAGARLPRDKREEFISFVNELFAKQRKR
ncbi:MAG: DHH family phosphoesterase [Candidatus Altiarchaeota archaeon]